MRRVEISQELHLSMEKVMNHIGCIQELHFQTRAFTHEVLSKLSLRAPRLQILKVSVESPYFPPLCKLFDGDPPALRILELSNCLVLLDSFKLSAD